MIKSWADDAWDEYLYWQEQDRKTLKKINKLIRSIERDGPLRGEGHPELLRDNLSGFYSRHIDDKNRLVYQISEDRIEILSCKEHYED